MTTAHVTPSPLLLTVAEAAEALRVSEKTIRRLVEAGAIPVVQLRRRGAIRIPQAALNPKEPA